MPYTSPLSCTDTTTVPYFPGFPAVLPRQSHNTPAVLSSEVLAVNLKQKHLCFPLLSLFQCSISPLFRTNHPLLDIFSLALGQTESLLYVPQQVSLPPFPNVKMYLFITTDSICPLYLPAPLNLFGSEHLIWSFPRSKAELQGITASVLSVIALPYHTLLHCFCVQALEVGDASSDS